MSISDKTKTINNEIEQNQAQCDLNRPTAKISALLSGNVNEYDFLVGEDVLPEKGRLERVAAVKRFQYSPLGKELNEQTDIPNKQYQRLDKIYEFN